MEEQETEETKPEEVTESKDMIANAKEQADRFEKENNRREELLLKEEAMIAKRMLQGRAEAGIPEEKPKKLTDDEYAEAMQKGEVDPFKEDGFGI